MPLPKFTLDDKAKTFYLHSDTELTFEMISECHMILRRIFSSSNSIDTSKYKFVQVTRKNKIDAFLADNE